MALLDQNTRFIYLVRTEFTDTGRLPEWHTWYEQKHIPNLMSVPGFVSASRYEERGGESRYLAAYEIESPAVFDEPRYREITGWGEWGPYLGDWRRAIYQVVDELDSTKRG